MEENRLGSFRLSAPKGRRQLFGTIAKSVQIGVVVYAIYYVAQAMVSQGALTSRETLQFLPDGLHWFSVLIFLCVFLAYLALDRSTNIAYVIPIALVYYCLHEVVFNVFFIPYNGFRVPAGVSSLWYELMEIIFVVTIAFVALCVRYRARFLRAEADPGRARMWLTVSLASWAVLGLLYGLRILVGFPVTINVYDLAAEGVTINDPVATRFELATNLIFAVAFFSTFTFVLWRRMRRSNQAAVVRGPQPHEGSPPGEG